MTFMFGIICCLGSTCLMQKVQLTSNLQNLRVNLLLGTNPMHVFRYDGTHFNESGNSTLFNELEGGSWNLLMSTSGVSVFPEDKQMVQS